MSHDRFTVVLADDHPLYREGLAGLLATTDDLLVVGTAADGDGALALAGELGPDVVVVDVNMPGTNGIDVTATLTSTHPGTAVLIVSMHADDDVVFRAMRAGARGYVVKSAEPETVLAAIRTVASGGAVFSPDLTARLASWFATLRREHGPLAHLTTREREVLELIVRGLDNAAIATRLRISPKTVRNLVSNVFAKLQVADRGAAVAKAREAGLG